MSSDGEQTSGAGGAVVPPRRGQGRSSSGPFAAGSRGGSGRSSGGNSGRGSGRRQAQGGQQSSFRARRRRRQQMIGGGVIAAVIVVIVVLVAVGLSSGSSSGPTGSSDISAATLASTNGQSMQQITSTYSQYGNTNPPIRTAGAAALTSGGKPEVVYMGAEYCPYCAGERWSMVMALSKFGTFANLHSISSSASDDPASIPTYTFYGSKYTSPYITFTPVEELTVDRKPLQNPTTAQQALLAKYDAAPYVPSRDADGIPFIAIGGYAVQDGLGYSIASQGDSALSNLTFSDLAGQVANQSSPSAAAITAGAAPLIADICQIDGGKSLDGDAACKALPKGITQAPAAG